MYGETSRLKHWFERKANSSLRPLRDGTPAIPGAPMKIERTLMEQFNDLRAQLKEVRGLVDEGREIITGKKQPPSGITIGMVREELAILVSRREDLTRQVGSMSRTLDGHARLAFETIFVQVANAKLPKDTFLSLVQEAREIWRRQGHNELLGPQTKGQRRRAHRKIDREAAIQ
jgi:antitoxin component HigA of HigAB toxin-antitoxin module